MGVVWSASSDAARCCGGGESAAARRRLSPAGSLKTPHGAMSRSTARMLELRPPGEFVVYLGGCANVPKMGLGANALSDCYADLHLESDADGAFVSPLHRTFVRGSTLDPVWNCYVAFPLRPRDTDVLVFRLLDSDLLKRDDRIGSLRIGVGMLRRNTDPARPGTFALAMDTMVQPPNPERPTTVQLAVLGPDHPGRRHGRRPATYHRMGDAAPGADPARPSRFPVANDQPFAVEKEFFLVRHGESTWNEARNERDVVTLVSSVDHPLNWVGVQQAQALNRAWKNARDRLAAPADGGERTVADLESLHRKFLAAERILASPLTRAVQTALLACQGHPALVGGGGSEGGGGGGGGDGKPLRLCRHLREKKRSGVSWDCVGSKVGEDIRDHATQALRKECGARLPAAEVEAAVSCGVDYYDCGSPWWTTRGRGDAVDPFRARMRELWATLKYMDESSAVLVGHSLFFRELVRTHLADECFQDGGSRQAFAAQLKERKLGNGACVYIKVRFPCASFAEGRPAASAPEIVDARLLFGTQLHP